MSSQRGWKSKEAQGIEKLEELDPSIRIGKFENWKIGRLEDFWINLPDGVDWKFGNWNVQKLQSWKVRESS